MDMKKLMVAFRNSANAPKKAKGGGRVSQCNAFRLKYIYIYIYMYMSVSVTVQTLQSSSFH
jgi:hypothetical protein